MEKPQKINLTEFDIATCSPHLQMLKAYIPYADNKQQYLIALFIRISELMETISFYRDMPSPSPLCRKKHDLEHMVKDISAYCSSKDAEILNMISQFSHFEEMYKIYETVNSADKSGEKKDPGMITGLLNNEQRKKYEQYMKMLNF